MSDASYLLALLRYVESLHGTRYPYLSVVLSFAVIAVTVWFLFRGKYGKRQAELTQCCVHISCIYNTRKSVDASTQTDQSKSSSRAVGTDSPRHRLSFSMECQTIVDSVEFEKMQSISLTAAPTTPTTVDNTDITYNEEDRRFGLSTDLRSFPREDESNVNDDMDYILKSAIQSALSEATVAPQNSLIPEVAYMDEDDLFNISATRSIESRKASSIFHDSDILFSSVTAWNPDVERYTTSDTVVSGGGIYRTLSEPIRASDEWMPMVAESDATSDSQPPLIAELSALPKMVQPSLKFESEVAKAIAEMHKAIVAGITSHLGENIANQINLIPYGSIASGCATSESSVDLVLIVPPDVMALIASKTTAPCRTLSNTSSNELPLNQLKEFETRLNMKQVLTLVSEILTSSSFSAVRITGVGSVSTNFSIVKVPTLSLESCDDSVRFEITCNNLFPLFSTRLIKAYRGVGGNVLKDFILLVKYWAQSRGILGNASGKMNGFVWSLLAVFYCQSACLGLLPSLQALCTERQQWKDPFGSRRCDVGFVDDLTVTGQGYLDGIDAGSLFVGFIDFYSNYWNWASGVISVRLGKVVSIDSPEILLKQLTPQPTTERFTRLHVEDPFDSKRDLGLCLNATTGAELRREFTNASLLIANGNSSVSQLFVESTPTVKSPRVAKKYVMTNRRTESCQ